MNRFFLLIFLLLAPAVVFAEDLANEDVDGLYARSIEKVLRLDDDQIDIAAAVLLLSDEWDGRVNRNRVRDKIDDMAWEIKSQAAGKNIRADYEIIPVINEYLFDELGFSSVSTAEDPEQLFLHSVLSKKRGYCLSLSILYLSIGERLGLPLYGVVVPGHFFVRYDDGRIRFNIETTQKGVSPADEHYLKKFCFGKNGSDSVYMQNLTNKQTLGCFFNNLANIYSNLDDTDTALKYQRLAVKINPSLAEARTNLGNIYLKKGLVDEAIREYQSALRINNADAKTHYNLGNAYCRIDRTDDAIEQYLRSLKMDPNFTDVHKSLAQAYQAKGLFDKAASEARIAISLKPLDCEAYISLGNIYQETKDFGLAVEQYKKALFIDSSSPRANYGLAYAYFESGMYDEAAMQFQTTIYYEPDNAGAYFGMALAYDELGWDEKKIEAYLQAIDIDPTMLAARQNLGNAYMTEKMYDEAVEQYEKGLGINPHSAELHYGLALVYSNEKLYEEAKIEYLAAIELRYEYPQAHNNLAISCYALGEYASALKHANIARQLGFDVPDDFIDEIRRNLE